MRGQGGGVRAQAGRVRGVRPGREEDREEAPGVSEGVGDSWELTEACWGICGKAAVVRTLHGAGSGRHSEVTHGGTGRGQQGDKGGYSGAGGHQYP